MIRVLPLLTLLACGSSADDDDVPTFVPPVTDTTDTSTYQTPGFVPSAFTLYAYFAVDSTGHLAEWTEGNQTLPPQVSIAVYDADESVDPCVVTMFMDNTVTVEPWTFEDDTENITQTSMIHVGFTVPATATVQTGDGCALWDDAESVVAHGWGVGVGTLRSDIEEIAADSTDFTFIADRLANGQLVGGSWEADLWTPSRWASFAAYASPAPGGVVDVDGNGDWTTFLTAAEITASPSSLPEGVYQFQPVYVWDYAAYFE